MFCSSVGVHGDYLIYPTDKRRHLHVHTRNVLPKKEFLKHFLGNLECIFKNISVTLSKKHFKNISETFQKSISKKDFKKAFKKMHDKPPASEPPGDEPGELVVPVLLLAHQRTPAVALTTHTQSTNCQLTITYFMKSGSSP
jgi:hypothetical protein